MMQWDFILCAHRFFAIYAIENDMDVFYTIEADI